MYQCKDCENEFLYPRRVFETHGQAGTIAEEYCVCPACGGTSISRLPDHYCHYCGIRLIERQGDYCSVACRKKGEAAYLRDATRKQRLERDPLMVAVREVEAYNKATGKHLSYGEYFGGKR